MVTQSNYLLICDSIITNPAFLEGSSQPSIGSGRWHFVLERIDGPERLEAVDAESYIHQDRLALLAVVRGLEAIEHASVVRLVTTSRYVDRGLRFGLPNWRETNYQWESFGAQKPIRNADLWQRVAIAMQYHEISSRLLKHRMAQSATDSQAEWEQETVTMTDPGSESLAPHTAMPPAFASKTFGQLPDALVTANRIAADKVIYRLDTAHRTLSGQNSLRRAVTKNTGAREISSNCTSRPTVQPAEHPAGRVQWWEMASRWENLMMQVGLPQLANCGI